jgi:hypothetical protein
MKKSFIIVFGIIFLCGLMLQAAIVNAYVAGYEYTDYQATQTHTEDGKWTTTSEWTDAMTVPNLVSGFHWRASWTQPADILQHFLVEVFTDNTNDTGDIVRQCYDCAANGGAAPQTDDVMVELVGNRLSGLSVYKGNGTGWVKYTGWTGTDVAAVASISSSPLSSTPHLIVEILVDKTTTADVSQASYVPWIYVSAYDASNSSAGVKSWPPAPSSSANVPNSWGQESGTLENIPEGFTIVTVVMLSSVAVVVGFYFLRKRPKTENGGAATAGEISYSR